jgi:hypothetical protein
LEAVANTRSARDPQDPLIVKIDHEKVPPVLDYSPRPGRKFRMAFSNRCKEFFRHCTEPWEQARSTEE